MANCPSEFKPILYRRYVDDTCLFEKVEHVEELLAYLNILHPNIKSTYEIEEELTTVLGCFDHLGRFSFHH